jgi:hypothetical protein
MAESQERRGRPIAAADRHSLRGIAERGVHRFSRHLPDIHILNLLLQGFHFLNRSGRLPRHTLHPLAEMNDYIFWRAIGEWSDFERLCVDKETSKVIARNLCPEINIPRTIEVIPANGLTLPSFVDKIRQLKGTNLVMKPTHSSGRALFLFGDIREEEIINMYKRAYEDYFIVFRERQYCELERKFIIEERIGGNSDTQFLPSDYKFFCSRGKVFLCQINAGRFTDHKKKSLVSVPDFVFQEVDFGIKRPNRPPNKPEHWDRLIDYASRLSLPFDFVRVDLYDTEQGIYFGEFTFTPGAGLDQFSDPQFSVDVMSRIKEHLAARQRETQ